MEIELIKGFTEGLRPEPALTVSEWADMYRRLDSTAAAEPGPYRTSRTPYLREIADTLSVFNPVKKVVIMKAAQVGVTELGNNFIGYVIDNAPGPILLVQPTDEMVKRNSKMRIAPMIEGSPRLREKVKSPRSRDSGNTITQKEFPGGILVMTGANSAVGLRSMAARYIMLDETDGFPMDVDGEGSPIALAEKRAATFNNRKILEISTPTLEGQSTISNDFMATDQRYYHVPCPHCGCEQILQFAGLRWEANNYENTVYVCEHCNEPIPERFKTDMLAAGRWVATAPENISPYLAGYHISALYSPFGWKSWGDIAEEWDKAQGDDNKLKTFYNTVLGETWKEKTEAPEWEKIYERAESYPLNKPFKDVVFITAGVDVQRDRLEVEIVGWMPRKQSQQLDYRVLPGDTSQYEVWSELDKLLQELWQREDKVLLPIRLLAVDSGYNTSIVYEWSKKHTFTRVIPVKGSESLDTYFSPPRAVDTTKHGKKIGKQKVWHVGVSYIKSETYGFLRLSKNYEGDSMPDGYCYFPKRDPVYFKGLTAEVLQLTRSGRGYMKYIWVKKYDRNEPLDCRVYARAAAAVIGMDRWTEEKWLQEAQSVLDTYHTQKEETERKIVKKQKPGSSFWNR